MKRLMIFLAGTIFGVAAVVTGGAIFPQLFSNHTPYAGQDAREISSLSQDDIRQLETGAGWGLAKPAEFNGYPGPAHVLELAHELALDNQQKVSVQNAFDIMNAKARELGVALIEAEAALDAAFQSGDVTPALLDERLRTAAELRAALRQTHLVAHLEVTPLLTAEQRAKYADLRGYGHDHSGGHVGH